MGTWRDKPWAEWSEIERRRERHRLEREFSEMGYRPADAAEMAVMAEEWADSLSEPTDEPAA